MGTLSREPLRCCIFATTLNRGERELKFIINSYRLYFNLSVVQQKKNIVKFSNGDEWEIIVTSSDFSGFCGKRFDLSYIDIKIPDEIAKQVILPMARNINYGYDYFDLFE